MRGDEAASIADHISAHCTQLKSIEWDYHFNGKESDNGVDDRLHIQQLQARLSSQGISFPVTTLTFHKTLHSAAALLNVNAASRNVLLQYNLHMHGNILHARYHPKTPPRSLP